MRPGVATARTRRWYHQLTAPTMTQALAVAVPSKCCAACVEVGSPTNQTRSWYTATLAPTTARTKEAPTPTGSTYTNHRVVRRALEKVRNQYTNQTGTPTATVAAACASGCCCSTSRVLASFWKRESRDVPRSATSPVTLVPRPMSEPSTHCACLRSASSIRFATIQCASQTANHTTNWNRAGQSKR